MSRPIDAKDLPPEIRRRLGPNAQLSAFDHVDADNRKRASIRKRSGNALEHELSLDHQLYLLKGLAKIEQAHAPTRRVKRQRGWELTFTGPAACDYYGIAKGVGMVVFDVKGCEEATYEHERKQWHQLEYLIDYAKLSTPAVPVRAFLLVIARSRGIAYVVEGPVIDMHYRTGKPIMLRDDARDRKWTHHFPVVRRPGGLMVPPDVVTWDWLAALQPTR